MSETQVLVNEKEEDVMAFVHNERKKFVTHMTQHGIPGEAEDKKLLLQVLKDMDSQAINRKRIKVDEKSNANHEAAAAIIARVLNASRGNQQHVIDGTYREIPILPTSIPEPILVTGETDTVIIQRSYEEFVSGFGPEEEEE